MSATLAALTFAAEMNDWTLDPGRLSPADQAEHDDLPDFVAVRGTTRVYVAFTAAGGIYSAFLQEAAVPEPTRSMRDWVVRDEANGRGKRDTVLGWLRSAEVPDPGMYLAVDPGTGAQLDVRVYERDQPRADVTSLVVERRPRGSHAGAWVEVEPGAKRDALLHSVARCRQAARPTLVWTQATPGGDWRAATPAMSADGAEYRISDSPDGWRLFIATPSTVYPVAAFTSLLAAQAEAGRTAR